MPRKLDPQRTVLEYFETAEIAAAQATLGFVQHILRQRTQGMVEAAIARAAAKPKGRPRGRKVGVGVKPSPIGKTAGLGDTSASQTAGVQ